MTSVILAYPAPPPADPSASPGWEQMRSVWTDWRGYEWDFTEPTQGLFLRRGGLRGLGMSVPKHYRDESPGLPGASYRDTTYGMREVFWPLHMFHDGSTKAYVERDDAFFRGLHPRRVGTWMIEVPGVSKRYLDLRFADDSSWAPDMDPTFYGWTSYGIRMEAESPHWYGEPEIRRFSAGGESSGPFHGGTTPGNPVINISSSSTVANAEIENKGDEPGWVVWKLTGPFSSAAVGVGDQIVEIPFAAAAGQTFIVDSRPETRTVFDHLGNDRYTDLGAVGWASVPDGEVAPLYAEAGAEGAVVEAYLVPQFHRAFGAVR